MSEQRYEGPTRGGMRLKFRHGCRIETIDSKHVDKPEYIAHLRENYWPVRPTDAAGWSLFLPDADLPNTGRKSPRVGQVWAFASVGVRFVARILKVDTHGGAPGPEAYEVLAGAYGGSMAPEGFFKFAVLLFDATGAPVEAPAPAERKLAPGWTREPRSTGLCYALALHDGPAIYERHDERGVFLRAACRLHVVVEVGPPARVGIVPQVFGLSVGILARGMRDR